ncbi:unnamed protein product [Cuscuta campestris]|uniref:Uncharacterized protein n=1 Tax=Cuscuta campestris TaxID=132261 RepID=A0A484KJ28_9ASTE|nr:unnamed protein product [Cuscuta campestris]
MTSYSNRTTYPQNLGSDILLSKRHRKKHWHSDKYYYSVVGISNILYEEHQITTILSVRGVRALIHDYLIPRLSNHGKKSPMTFTCKLIWMYLS